MIALALVEANLAIEIDGRLAEPCPADFIVDIQPGQLAGPFADRARDAGREFAEVPMLRGPLTRLNGTPVEQAKVAPEAQWALRSFDRGLDLRATLPKGSRNRRRASWWPADYQGPPLASI